MVPGRMSSVPDLAFGGFDCGNARVVNSGCGSLGVPVMARLGWSSEPVAQLGNRDQRRWRTLGTVCVDIRGIQ